MYKRVRNQACTARQTNRCIKKYYQHMTSVRSNSRSSSSDLHLDNNKLSELPPDVFSDLSSLRSLVCLNESETVPACVCVCDGVWFQSPPPYRKHIFRGNLFIVSSHNIYSSMCEYNTFSHLITFAWLHIHTYTHSRAHTLELPCRRV